MLENLVALAHEKSTERRRELLNGVTELFFVDEEQRTGAQIELFDSVMCALIKDVESSARADLAERLAPCEKAPENLVVTLANDEIEIALPILEKSKILSDDHLLNIVKSKGQQHLLAISNRETLNSTVTDALIERGNSDVHRSVAKNEGADLSKDGYFTLCSLGQEDSFLVSTLQGRSNFIDLKAYGELADAIFTRLDQKQISLDEAEAEKVGRHLYAKMESAQEATSVDFDRVNSFHQKIREHKMDINTAMWILLKNDRFVEVGCLLAVVSGLDRQIGVDSMINPKDEPMIILSRTAGLNEKSFLELAKVRARRMNRVLEHRKLCRAFNGLSLEAAQRVARFLKVKTTLQAAS